MPVTAATAAAATGPGSTDRPARARGRHRPVGVPSRSWHRPGRAPAGRSAAVTAAASAASSKTTRGAMTAPVHRLAELGHGALEQAAGPAAGHRLVHQRVDVRPAPEVGVGDRDVAVRGAQHDPAVLVRIGGAQCAATRLVPVQPGEVGLADVDARQHPALVARSPRRRGRRRPRRPAPPGPGGPAGRAGPFGDGSDDLRRARPRPRPGPRSARPARSPR